MSNHSWADSHPWIDDPEEVKRRVKAAGSLRKLAAETGIPKTTLIRRARAETLTVKRDTAVVGESPGVQRTDDTVRVVTPKTRFVEHLTPEDVLAGVVDNPADWSYTWRKNTWEGPIAEGRVETFHQLVVNAKRLVPVEHVIPARESAYKRKNPPRPTVSRETVLWALCGDVHAPHEHRGLDSCWQQWLQVNAPHGIVNTGDLGNWSKPSRHRANLADRFNDTPNECSQGGFEWWRRTIDACPNDPHCVQLPGNHDYRASIATLEKVPELYDYVRPGEQLPWHDLSYVYGLDIAGVELVRPDGEYFAAEFEVAPGLFVTHGTKHGPTGGAYKASANSEDSGAQGHDHKQSIVRVVRYRGGERIVHTHCSVGMMGEPDLGYRDRPDTHLGFATVSVHADGLWNIELALYDDREDVLLWRDQRFSAFAD